jgi:hypothetical protein
MDVRKRVVIETALSAASFVFCVLTAVWKDWIELVFRFDPDHHSGSVEWGIAAAALALSLVFAAVARLERRRLVAATAAG